MRWHDWAPPSYAAARVWPQPADAPGVRHGAFGDEE
eukprot:gene38083-39495_t